MRPIVKKWPMAVATVVAVVSVGIVAPWVDWDKVIAAVEQWKRPKTAVIVKQPTVLLVSRLERDRFLVRNTLEPRGYDVRVVDSAEAGRGVLDEDSGDIALVVADQTMPGLKKLFQASRVKCPHARLVELHGRREAAEVSSVLVNVVD